MSHKGPIFTLLVGVTLAAVLLTLSTRAHTRSVNAQAVPAPSAAALPSPSVVPSASAASAPPSPAATVSKPPPASGSTTYAGRASSGGATIGMTMKNGSVIAYVCDGARTEAWMHGTASAGKLTLSGTDSSHLTGTYTATTAAVTVTATGHKWSFSPKAVHKPSGLWRGAANVRGAKIVAGWVVLADGTQVGVTTVDGKPQPAPAFNATSGTATINGGSVPVTPAEPTP